MTHLALLEELLVDDHVVRRAALRVWGRELREVFGENKGKKGGRKMKEFLFGVEFSVSFFFPAWKLKEFQ